MSRPRIEGQDTWSLTLLIQSEILSRFIFLFISSETNRHHQFISSGINRHCRQIQHKEVNLDNNLNVQSYFPVQFTSVLVPGHTMLPNQNSDVIQCAILSGFIYSFPRQLGDNWHVQSLTGTRYRHGQVMTFVISPGFFPWLMNEWLNTNLD
jgi:hypothetical protein